MNLGNFFVVDVVKILFFCKVGNFAMNKNHLVLSFLKKPLILFQKKFNLKERQISIQEFIIKKLVWF
jgi:hypothetical protein